MNYTITKEFKFEASHQLVGHDGKCARPHGHSWRFIVELSSDQLIEGGAKAAMVHDYEDIKKEVDPVVSVYLDHWHLNDTLKTNRPTSEFIARWIYEKLKPVLPLLCAVTVFETCTASCRYAPRQEIEQ